jgi:microsomal epoxide hydrolase
MKNVWCLIPLLILLSSSCFAADKIDRFDSKFFRTSDDVQLHYLEGGDRANPTIVFVPGWTMPAFIWHPQMDALAAKYHVVALDPRSQGESDKPADGNYPERCAQDIEELINHLGVTDITLVGWSLAVPESLVYVDRFGTDKLRGLVLVDGFVNIDPQLANSFYSLLKAPQVDRAKWTDGFVRSMYRKPQSEDYLRSIEQASMRTPTNSAVVLAFDMTQIGDLTPVLAKINKPVLYVNEPQLAAQAQMLKAKFPSLRVETFEDAGHALFVDDAERFNRLLDEFISGSKP